MNGGSNYISITGNLDSSMLFGVFQSNVDTVKQQMAIMKAAGQTMIAFVMWFSDLQADHFPDPYGYRVSSSGGNLSAQLQQNVIDVLSIAEATGFSEIHFRFAPQAGADPASWTQWNEAQYLQNESFILNVRDLVASHTTVQTFFDLSVETVGEGQFSTQYISRLWSTYVAKNGSNDASFSMICGLNVGQLYPTFIQDLKAQSLPIPDFLMVDVYGNEFRKLRSLRQGMIAAKVSRPVYIQETFYNDPLTARNVKRAKTIPGLRIRAIFQWPQTRTQSGDFPLPFPMAFNNYAGI